MSGTANAAAGMMMRLDALPTECLALILGHLLDARDVVSCLCSSKCFSPASDLQMTWEQRLAKLFDIRVQPTGRGAVDWRALYRDVAQTSALGAIRFRALFTDGGCEEGLMQYHPDHLFIPNHWESYCSATGSNVHVIGLLLGGRVPLDESEEEIRAYIIDRCRIPAQVVADNGGFAAAGGRESRLEAWSTSELEHLLLMLYNQLEMGMGLGRLLLGGVKASEVPDALIKLHQVCNSLPTRHQARRADNVAPSDEPHAMLDAALLPLLRTPAAPDAHNHIAVVNKLYVSRAGPFSCPLHAGVVLLGDWRRALRAAPDGRVCGDSAAVTARMQDVAAEAACRAFDNVVDRAALAAVEGVAAAGLAPRPVAWGGSAAGEWFELDPDWRPPGGGAGLRPVAWFRFFSKEEAAAAAERLGGAVASGSPPFRKRFAQPLRYDQLPAPVYELQAAASAAPRNPAAAAASATGTAAAGPATEDPSAARLPGLAPGGGAAGSNMNSSQGMGEQQGEEHGEHPAEQEGGFQLAAFEVPQLLQALEGEEGSDDEDMALEAASGDEEGQILDQGGDGGDVGAPMPGRGLGESTVGRSMLEIPLTRRHAGSLALVKLIDAENLMHEWGDEHEDMNVDVAAVAFRGRRVVLPPTVRPA